MLDGRWTMDIIQLCFLLGKVSKLLAVIKLGRYGNIAVRLYGLY